MSGHGENGIPGGERPSWTDREDQLGAGFRDLTCHSCRTVVRVRKMSLAQTSVQWPAGTSCPTMSPDADGTPSEACPELWSSIRAAVQAGSIPVGPQ